MIMILVCQDSAKYSVGQSLETHLVKSEGLKLKVCTRNNILEDKGADFLIFILILLDKIGN